MDILYTLIPLSILLVFGILVALSWAVNAGQFEDLDAEAERILLDDDMSHTPPGAKNSIAAQNRQKAPPGEARRPNSSNDMPRS